MSHKTSSKHGFSIWKHLHAESSALTVHERARSLRTRLPDTRKNKLAFHCKSSTQQQIHRLKGHDNTTKSRNNLHQSSFHFSFFLPLFSILHILMCSKWQVIQWIFTSFQLAVCCMCSCTSGVSHSFSPRQHHARPQSAGCNCNTV